MSGYAMVIMTAAILLMKLIAVSVYNKWVYKTTSITIQLRAATDRVLLTAAEKLV